MSTQLYAKIKKSSKYVGQNDLAERNPEMFGLPFPVELHGDALDYCVKGGPGGQYQLSDVHLFAKSEGALIKIK